jgi:hypothetical protein
MRCPRCASDKVYLSYSANERLPRLLRLFLVCGRCHSCSKRIYRPKLGLSAFKGPSGMRWTA